MKAILTPLDAATRPINDLAKPITGSPDYAPAPAETAPLSKRASITPPGGPQVPDQFSAKPGTNGTNIDTTGR